MVYIPGAKFEICIIDRISSGNRKAVELTNDDGSDPEDKMRSLENTTKEMAENFNFFLHSGN